MSGAARYSPRRLWATLVVRLGYRWLPRVASWFRKRWVLLRNPHADIRFLGPVYLGPGFSLDMPEGGHFVVGAGVEFRHGFRAELAGPDARIQIGEGTKFTYDTLLQCTTSITIGERCGLGQAVIVVDGNHRFRDLSKPTLYQGYDYRPIVIEDDVAIPSKVTVMANVGRRSWLAANCVVTKDVPPYCVVGGVPARIIDYFGPPGGEPEGWPPPG